MAADKDMSTLWHAHAPPPPPISPSSRSPNKPRRSSSFDPLAVHRSGSSSFDVHTQGGVLPPDSFSPEPPRPRRASTATPVQQPQQSQPQPPLHHQAATLRQRSKTSSNPTPPAPSAFYNYQHQLQQRQQHGRTYSLTTAQPPQLNTHSHSLNMSNPASPASYAQHAPLPNGPAQSLPPQTNTAPFPAYHHSPTADLTQPVYAAPPTAATGWSAYAASHPYAQQATAYPAPYPAQPPVSSYAVPSSTYYAVPPQYPQQAMSNGYPTPQHPPPPSGAQPFPSMSPLPATGPAPPGPPQASPISPHTTDLSRQSTVSSVSSTRRPLPSPRTTASTNGSPLASQVGSIRRDLPRPPTTSGTVSSVTVSNLPSSKQSPGTSAQTVASRLPPSALNRTESVRMAAEALMASGVPQRRPLRSALGSNTFVAPAASRTPASADHMSASQSEPVTKASQHPRSQDSPSPSQSAGPGIPSSNAAWSASQNGQEATRAPATYQSAVEQTRRRDLPTRPANHSQASPDELANSFARVSVNAPSSPHRPASPEKTSIRRGPLPSMPPAEPEPEKPRRRGGSISRSRPVSPAPPPVIVEPTQPTIPTISVGSDDDDDSGPGPKISISCPDDDDSHPPGVPSISISGGGDDDEDDRRSMGSNSSKGPSISVSFSGNPVPKAQRAGTSEAPSAASGPYAWKGREAGAASASSVGGGAQCFGCRKYIAGKVVHAINSTFHPACFVCAHCSEGLEHVAFYEKDGLPYCHFDYHELFSRRCFHCRTPIVDERFITVQDEELTGSGDGEPTERSYHELHFFCANCGDPFLDPKAAGSAAGADPSLVSADEDGRIRAGGMEFIVHKGYAYCEKCHIQLHKPRCKACRKPIVGDVVSALNAKYHPECFVCTRCERPFEETSFFVHQGKAYDEDCYKVILRGLV